MKWCFYEHFTLSHLIHFNMFSVWSIVCYGHMTCSWLLTKTGAMWDLHLLLRVKLSPPSCCSLAHVIQCPTTTLIFLYQLILQIKRCLAQLITISVLKLIIKNNSPNVAETLCVQDLWTKRSHSNSLPLHIYACVQKLALSEIWI